jgi:transcriptional antiterminator RfaH
MSGTQTNAQAGDAGLLPEEPRAWFCLRTQPKHEHIAAANLRLLPDVEVFNPRIRYRRSTRRGPVWFTESLFPSYLFARFDWRLCLRQIHHAAGVSTVVHFGSRWPTLPDAAIADLKTAVGEQELRLIDATPQPGEEIQISGGAFHGLNAIVSRLVPARERVAVLLEFLGRQTMVEVPLQSVVRLPSGETFIRQRHTPRVPSS